MAEDTLREWRAAAAAYEADPRELIRAWVMLSTHPAFLAAFRCELSESLLLRCLLVNVEADRLNLPAPYAERVVPETTWIEVSGGEWVSPEMVEINWLSGSTIRDLHSASPVRRSGTDL